jgi:hypothetical protein
MPIKAFNQKKKNSSSPKNKSNGENCSIPTPIQIFQKNSSWRNGTGQYLDKTTVPTHIANFSF